MSEITKTDISQESGYDRVQLGPKFLRLPSDWKVVSLGDVADINMGSSPKSEFYNESGDGIPFFQGNADFGFYHPKITTWCTNPNKTAEAGQLLLSVRAPVGDLNIAQEHCCIGRGLAAIDSEEIDSTFLYYLLKLEKSRLQTYSQGSTFKSVNSGVLNTFPVQYPPLSEQRRIADILSTVDKQIQQTKNVIENTVQVKKGLAQDLYGKNVADDQFPERATDLPEGWTRTEISELCTIGGGSTPSKSNSDYWGGEVLWASPKDFNGPLLEDTEDKLTEFAIENSSLTTYEPGSIAIVVRSGVLRHTLPVAKIVTDSTVNQDVKVLQPNEETVVPEYLFQIMKMQGNRIRQRCMKTGTTVESIETSFLEKYKVRIPPREEQKRIADILSTLDTKIRLEQENQEDLKELKRGLMQDLLTGTKRVDPEQA